MKNVLKESARTRAITDILDQWGYKTPSLIGQGAFSQVYRVKAATGNEIVACKVSEHTVMLREEWEVLSGLEHPVIPKAYEWREKDGYVFLFQEYIEGSNLEQYVVNNGKLSTEQTMHLGEILAETFCYLHELNNPIIFRDLKPENIMIGEEGSVKLLDFGGATRLRKQGLNMAGTPGYAAPEQWKQNGSIGCYSDVYAMGKVLMFAWKHKRGRGWFARLLADCTQDRVEERIPNMRCFLARMTQKGRKFKEKQNALLYQQSVLRL